MSVMADSHWFVWEIGVEEIPSQYLDALVRQLSDQVERRLAEGRLPAAGLRAGATPRRLVVHGRVPDQQLPQAERVKGPSLAVAYRDGEPTPALMGFARRVGSSPEELQVEGDGPGAHVLAMVQKPVAKAKAVLAEILAAAFDALALPRSMHWGHGDIRFIRPVRWTLLFLGDEPIPLRIAGVESAPVTFGNRTDHPEPLTVTSATDYFHQLEVGKVMLDPDARAAVIRQEGGKLAADAGGVMVADPELLAEVTNLVEWPTPFLGQFDPDFLAVPDPILVTSMKVHQRYFPVRDHAGRLLPLFVGVRNGQGKNLDLVRAGNEKVLRARLKDAAYFFAEDRKHALADLVPKIESVIFHTRLGTYGDKLDRMRRLYQKTRDWWDLSEEQDLHLLRALELYKCDLATHVVQEFPELQGIMGGVYAALDGEHPEVAKAIEDQYRPGFPGDRIPDGRIGQVLGLLDRVDTVMMGMAGGLKPTGSEDPFGLRRYALAIGRLVMEAGIPPGRSLRDLMEQAGMLWQVPAPAQQDAYGLVKARLENMLSEEYPLALVRAALTVDTGWDTLATRLSLLQAWSQDAGFADFQTAFKRMWRVAGDVEPKISDSYPLPVETRLARAVESLEQVPFGDYQRWWHEVQTLVPEINRFFDQVLVMDPDSRVRQSRLGLLSQCCQAFRRYFAVEELP